MRLAAIARVVEELRDAEVEQPRCAAAIDEDVARLDVAMNDQLLMRVLQRGRNLEDETHAVAHRELARVGRERHAVDQLHHQVRQAIVGRAAIEQADDAAVIERGEQLALVAQPGDQQRRCRDRPQDLDRDIADVLGVIARGAVDGAHPALADHRYKPVRSDPRADVAVDHRLLQQRRAARHGVVERVRRAVDAREQHLDLAAKRAVVIARAIEERVALDDRELDRVAEDVLDLSPALRRHALTSSHREASMVAWNWWLVRSPNCCATGAAAIARRSIS